MESPTKTKKAITISVRLTKEQHRLVQQLCRLKHMSQTAYLATLAIRQARQEPLDYAVQMHREGKASLSALATQTGLDVPSIMEALTPTTAQEASACEALLAAAQSLAQAHHDPEFYALAVQALTSQQPQGDSASAV